MAASRKKVVETFTKISGIGPAYAESCYDDLGLRSLEDFVEAGENGKLQSLKGVGAAKEKNLVKSAQALIGESAKPKSKKSSGKAKTPKQPKTPKTPKKEAPKKEAPKPEKEAPKAKKEAPKPEKEAPKAKKEEPKRPPRSTSDFEDRARESKSTPGKRPTIPGLLFKIGKKLVSRLLS